METLSRHLLIEFWGCNEQIDHPETVRRMVVEAVEAIGATILNLHVHTFRPQGVTGLAVLAESHFSIHTWPEHGYLAADVFTCGHTTDPQAAVPVLRRYFQPDCIEVQEIQRGLAPSTALRPRVKCRRWRRRGSPSLKRERPDRRRQLQQNLLESGDRLQERVYSEEPS